MMSIYGRLFCIHLFREKTLLFSNKRQSAPKLQKLIRIHDSDLFLRAASSDFGGALHFSYVEQKNA